jgi:hypothetical protein
MELARAKRDVFRAEKSLADCVVREHEVMANLSKFKSSVSEQKLDKVDVGLGYMRIAFKRHGLSHHTPVYTPTHGKSAKPSGFTMLYAIHTTGSPVIESGRDITIQLD